MRRLLIGVMVVVLATAATPVHSATKPFTLYAGGGLTLGSAPQTFTDFHKEGYHLMAGLGLKLIPVIEVVGKVEYHSFSKDFDEFAPDFTDIDGGTKKMLMIGADARLGADVPTAPLTPFLFAGIGLARISEDGLINAIGFDYTKPDNDTQFYINIGGGIEFKMFQVLNVFVQGKYVSISQEGDDLVIIPLTVGIKL